MVHPIHWFRGLSHKWFRLLLLLNGLGMSVSYPLAMIINEEVGWIWDVPARNPPMEHMLVAISCDDGTISYGQRLPTVTINFIC